MKNKIEKKIQNIFANASQHPLIILSVQIFWGWMLTISCILRDWWIVIIAILFNYSLKRKWFSDNIQKFLIVALPFLYMLYIRTPLTDGTIGQMIRDMRNG